MLFGWWMEIRYAPGFSTLWSEPEWRLAHYRRALQNIMTKPYEKKALITFR